jgi:protein TonB
MRTLLFTLLLFITSTFLASSQSKTDTIYLNKNFDKTSKKRAVYYRCISEDSQLFHTKTYKITGKVIASNTFVGELTESGTYMDKKFLTPHGLVTKYYSNGKAKHEVMYVKGWISGVVKSYYDNGNIKRLETYKNDSLLGGKYYTIDGRDTTLLPYNQAPTYKYGLDALKKYIYTRMRYPVEMQQRLVQGVAYLGVTITPKGRIDSVKYLSVIDDSFNAEANRLIMLTDGDWIPGISEGEVTTMAVVVPIVFQLK